MENRLRFSRVGNARLPFLPPLHASLEARRPLVGEDRALPGLSKAQGRPGGGQAPLSVVVEVVALEVRRRRGLGAETRELLAQSVEVVGGQLDLDFVSGPGLRRAGLGHGSRRLAMS